MLRLSVLVAVPCFAACVTDKEDGKKETDRNFANYNPLSEWIAKADKVILYEGLPHQEYEGEELEKERKSKKTISFNGFPFYSEPLDLKAADAKKLTNLYCDPSSFRAWKGYKRCGGFHPDYCIEWRKGKETCRALVC